MASFFFAKFWDNLVPALTPWTQNVNPGSDTLYMALVTTDPTSHKDTWATFSDVTGEATGTGYTAGGQACTQTILPAATNSDLLTISIADVTWTTITTTASGAIVYKHVGGSPSTSYLYFYISFGGNFSTTAGTFVVHMATQFGLQN